jgi:hypothetical protein
VSLKCLPGRGVTHLEAVLERDALLRLVPPGSCINGAQRRYAKLGDRRRRRRESEKQHHGHESARRCFADRTTRQEIPSSLSCKDLTELLWREGDLVVVATFLPDDPVAEDRARLALDARRPAVQALSAGTPSIFTEDQDPGAVFDGDPASGFFFLTSGGAHRQTSTFQSKRTLAMAGIGPDAIVD